MGARDASGLYLGRSPAGPLLAGAEQGVLALGPPRSGKTSALIVPNILCAPGAVVSTSTKLDVLAATVANRQRAGRCWLFDPSGTVDAPAGVELLRWSPISAAGTWDGALAMARAMVQAARPATSWGEASHWSERAEALLGPLLHAAARSGADTRVLAGWVNRHQAKPALDALRAAGSSTAVDVLEGIVATDERELSGIWSTAAGVMGAYRSGAALERTAAPNWDAAPFVASADTVYVCATGRYQALVAPLVVGLIEAVRAEVYARAAALLAAGGPPAPPVLLALDEVATIAPLPELAAMVADGGGQGLITLACLQDLSQARARWGQAADGFLSLFGATVLLRGIGDVRTLQAASALAGDGLEPVRSDHEARSRTGRSRSVTWTTRRQPNLAVDEIAAGHDGYALVVGGGQRPGWVRLTRWWENEPWRSLALGPPAPAVQLERAAPSRWARRAEGRGR